MRAVAAGRTDEARRPAEPLQVVEAIRIGPEPRLELTHGPRIVLAGADAPRTQLTPVKWIPLVPLMWLTGLAQSPGFTAAWPWLLDLFGGRQSARTLHSLGTVVFVLFVVIHVLEVMAVGA